MTFDASQAFKYSMDFVLAYTSIIGVTPYQVYVVQIKNDQIDINDTDSARIVSSTRITVADGYRSYAAPDGYLNPILAQDKTKGEQLIISNGKLTANRLLLGPLVFSYTANNFSGGIDPQLFQPAIGSNNNLTVYVQIQGPGLSPTGNFFTIDEIAIDSMSGLSYQVILKSNNLTVSI